MFPLTDAVGEIDEFAEAAQDAAEAVEEAAESQSRATVAAFQERELEHKNSLDDLFCVLRGWHGVGLYWFRRRPYRG